METDRGPSDEALLRVDPRQLITLYYMVGHYSPVGENKNITEAAEKSLSSWNFIRGYNASQLGLSWENLQEWFDYNVMKRYSGAEETKYAAIEGIKAAVALGYANYTAAELQALEI